jgi:dTDP-4-amino-4,6-dideoxygalactose transaminase
MRELDLIHPARLDAEAQARYEGFSAEILGRSRYRVADGHASRVAELVAGRLALGDGWSALPVRSGTDALVRALRLSGVGPGAEVVVPDLAFHAVAASVLELGAVPVAADISPVDWNLDPVDLGHRLSDRTAAVVAVDNYGTPVDLAPLAALSKAAGIPLILDACESLGAEYPDGGPDRFADFVVTSFSFTKPVHAAGMGGALCGPTGVIEEARRSPLLLGPQLQLPELNAAYLEAAWPALDANLSRLRAVHSAYVEAGAALGCTTQAGSAQSTRLHSGLLAPSAAERDRLVGELAARGVPTRDYFPSQSRLLGLGAPPPVSAVVADRVFCLPGGPAMPDDDLAIVLDALATCGSATVAA